MTSDRYARLQLQNESILESHRNRAVELYKKMDLKSPNTMVQQAQVSASTENGVPSWDRQSGDPGRQQGI